MQVDAKAEVQGRPIGATCCLSPPLSALLPVCSLLSSHCNNPTWLEIRLQNSVYKMCNWQTFLDRARARVWNRFWPTNNFSRFFMVFFFQPLWEIVTVSKSFFVCHWFVGPVTERHFVSSQRKFSTAEYDEYNSPLINTIPPFIHSFCVCNCRYNSFYNYIKYTKSHSKSSRTELTQFEAPLNFFLGYEPPTNCQKRQLRKLQLIFS